MTQDLSRTAAGVQFVGVSKTYPTGLTAIAGLDLDIQPGEFLTLLGPSGSGKTTALNLLAGFQSPTTGKILVDGKDIGALPPHKRDIGAVGAHGRPFRSVRLKAHFKGAAVPLAGAGRLLRRGVVLSAP